MRGEVVNRVLEPDEVARGEKVDRAPVRTLRTRPAVEQRRAGALLGVGEQIEQDAELGPVVELAAEQLERARVERPDQLLVRQAEELLQLLRAVRRADSRRRTLRTRSRR